MSISTPFIRRPVATSLLMAAILLVGMVAYTGQWWLETRRPAKEVVAGSRLSATIRALSSSDQRRRRPTPVITSSRRKPSAFVPVVER